MEHGYPSDWPEVSEAQFRALLETLDYRREAWSNVIVYHEHPTRREFAYELHEPTRYLVHPWFAKMLFGGTGGG